MNLMPFDLAKWKAGEHDGVYTRDERKVIRLEEWPELTRYKLVGLVVGEKMTSLLYWMASGSYWSSGNLDPLDLMLRVCEGSRVLGRYWLVDWLRRYTLLGW